MSPDEALINTRPTFEVDGETETELAGTLLSLTITESVTDVARCEARFRNWGATANGDAGFLFFDNDLLAFGSRLRFRAEGVTLFDGVITAVEGLYSENDPPELQVFADGLLAPLRSSRRNRVFEEMTDADVIRELANEYGLQTDFATGADGSIQEVIAQVDESDLAFMLRLARRNGLSLWMEADTVHLQERPVSQDPLVLAFGAELSSFRVRADLAQQVTELGVTGWDVDAKEEIDEVVDDDVLQLQAYGTETGGSLVDRISGDRIERLPRLVPLSTDEAGARAEAEFLARAYRFVVGDGIAKGNALMRPGKIATLEGLGSLFDGSYFVAEVRHCFDGDGHRTEFTVERPALNDARASSKSRTKRRKRKKPKTGKPAGKPIAKPHRALDDHRCKPEGDN
jgi:phage protein D